ncbi:MAG: DUF2589 domain-containing protein [Oscillospiraceae bacterium]|jgi:hypothetical protein|nr:DUF2589 domain-containing protein [Oscillospiraceae bacterium]
MADTVKSMVGLPLGMLISQPIIEVAKGQAELCRVYLNTLFELAFVNGKDGEAKTIKFTLQRPVVDEEGNTQMTQCEVQAPLLSLVPVPSFTMDETTVRFNMEVKSQEVSKDTSSAESQTSGSFSAWGFKASISGKVASSSERTRSTDQSAKYELYARAVQQPPAEGMAKLTSIFASVIEPITPAKGG